MHRIVAASMLCLLSACSSVLGPERPDLSITVWPEVPLPSTHLFQVVVDGREYTLPVGSEPRSTLETRAPRTGTLPVSATLLDPSGEVLARAEFEQEFRLDFNHWVAADVGSRRALGHCIGELIAVPVGPGATEGADTMFVMYGSISEGAIC